MYFERTLITRVTTSLGKASKLEIGVDTKSHKKIAFHTCRTVCCPNFIFIGNGELMSTFNSYENNI